MQNKKEDRLKDREVDATSSDTLEDLEKNEQASDSGSRNDSGAPSPDGAIDERHEADDAGPT